MLSLKGPVAVPLRRRRSVVWRLFASMVKVCALVWRCAGGMHVVGAVVCGMVCMAGIVW